MSNKIQNTVNVLSKTRFNPWDNMGDMLLVGEGNLSFAKSLLQLSPIAITHMTATTFEKEKNLPKDTVINAQHLRRRGAIVLHDVDATQLEKSIKPCHFDTIVFQFPNVGNRDPKYNHNPNHILVRKFLKNAISYLKPNGKIMITTVDNPHYHGAFQFGEAAKFAELDAPVTYPFYPTMFSEYVHTNTNDDKSSINEHSKFIT